MAEVNWASSLGIGLSRPNILSIDVEPVSVLLTKPTGYSELWDYSAMKMLTFLILMKFTSCRLGVPIDIGVN